MEHIPTASQMLHVWEQGRFQTPAQRAFSLLALAVPAVSNEHLGGYGIGQRDQELLRLRERIFGSRMTGTAQCPACGQEIELDFSVSDIRAPATPDAAQMHTIQIGEYDLRFRLPTCGDLAMLATNGAADGLKPTLLQNCVAEARRNGKSIAASALPEEMTAALSRHMAELDPQGDIELSLICPKCSRAWESPMDIASYFWNELHAWAGRILSEVHALAAAYGWRESDILAMSPWRRQAYLELIRQ
jgi:hypothetical protein